MFSGRNLFYPETFSFFSLKSAFFFQTKVSLTQLGEMERLSKITWNIQNCVRFCNERKFLQNFLFFTLKDEFFFQILHVLCIYSWIWFFFLFRFSPLSGFDLLRLHSRFILDNIFFMKLLILKYLPFFFFLSRLKMPCRWHVIHKIVTKNLIFKKFQNKLIIY